VTGSTTQPFVLEFPHRGLNNASDKSGGGTHLPCSPSKPSTPSRPRSPPPLILELVATYSVENCEYKVADVEWFLRRRLEKYNVTFMERCPNCTLFMECWCNQVQMAPPSPSRTRSRPFTFSRRQQVSCRTGARGGKSDRKPRKIRLSGCWSLEDACAVDTSRKLGCTRQKGRRAGERLL